MATAAPTLPDWDAGPTRYPVAKRLGLVAALAAPVIVAAVVLTILWGGGFDIGAIAGTTAFLMVLLRVAWRAQARMPLRTLRARPLEHPRFVNIVTGLSQRIGTKTPRLLEVDGLAANALVFGTRRPSIAVTRPLLETFTRTEQEAVAAHCVLRIYSGHLLFTHLAAVLGRSGSRFAPRVGFEDDIHAVALTRYPPALESAIQKAKPNESATAPFWFVAHSTSHRHPTERIAALRDL